MSRSAMFILLYDQKWYIPIANKKYELLVWSNGSQDLKGEISLEARLFYPVPFAITGPYDFV
jgi:hypothetical protein